MFYFLPAIAQSPRTFLPVIRPMPSMQIEWVGRQMSLNGLPMSLKRYRYSGKGEDVVRHYQHAWRGTGTGEVDQLQFKDLTYLTFKQANYIFSVSVRQENSKVVSGEMTVSMVPEVVRADTRTGFPLPDGSRVESRIESFDEGQYTESLDGVCSSSVWSCSHRLISKLEAEGWRIEKLGHSDLGSVISGQRGAEVFQVTFQSGKETGGRETRLFVHWLKSP
jgi:hypothetical protein